MRKFEEGAAMQVAHVVRDLDAALRRHWDVFRIGPWDIWDFNPETVRDYTYRGKPATHSCIIACAWRGDTQLELMQPTGGYCIYDEFLEAHGEGLHHIGYRVDDCAQALADMVAAGATPIDAAPRPGSRGTTVAFIHPKGAFGTLIELVQE